MEESDDDVNRVVCYNKEGQFVVNDIDADVSVVRSDNCDDASESDGLMNVLEVGGNEVVDDDELSDKDDTSSDKEISLVDKPSSAVRKKKPSAVRKKKPKRRFQGKAKTKEEKIMRRERILQDRLNPFEIYDELQFQSLFRFRKHTVLMIVAALRLPDETRGGGFLPLLQVCMCLRFLATGRYQLTSSSGITCTSSGMSRIMWRFIKKVIKVLIHKVKLTDKRCKAAKVHYQEKYGFSNVIGVTDCVHFHLSSARVDFDEYLNKNSWFSINVQLTCDHEGNFIDVDCSWPGGVADSKVFKESSLHRRLKSEEVDGVVLADCAFPLTPFCMTPFVEPLGNQIERAFNKVHFSAWTIVQETVVEAKKRFPVLDSELKLSLERIPSLLMAIFILNNIAKERNEPIVDEEEEEENEGGWNMNRAQEEYQAEYSDDEDDEDNEPDEDLRKQGDLLRDQFALACL